MYCAISNASIVSNDKQEVSSNKSSTKIKAQSSPMSLLLNELHKFLMKPCIKAASHIVHVVSIINLN